MDNLNSHTERESVGTRMLQMLKNGVAEYLRATEGALWVKGPLVVDRLVKTFNGQDVTLTPVQVVGGDLGFRDAGFIPVVTLPTATDLYHYVRDSFRYRTLAAEISFARPLTTLPVKSSTFQLTLRASLTRAIEVAGNTGVAWYRYGVAGGSAPTTQIFEAGSVVTLSIFNLGDDPSGPSFGITVDSMAPGTSGGGGSGWDDVLAITNTSGANNPTISTGQHLAYQSAIRIRDAVNNDTSTLAIATTQVPTAGSFLAGTTVYSGTVGTAYGAGSRVTTEGVAFGYNANSATRATAIGYNVQTAADSVSVGHNAASTTNATAVGKDSLASAQNALALGNGVTASGLLSTAVGSSTSATANYAVAVGHNCTASAADSTALGVSATTSTFVRSTALGYGATSTTQDQMMLGTGAPSVHVVSPGEMRFWGKLYMPWAVSPTVAVTSGGGSVSLSSNSTDNAGIIVYTSAGITNFVVTVTFNSAFTELAPFVFLTQTGAVLAIDLTVLNRTTSSFQVEGGALTADIHYIQYLCIGSRSSRGL